MDYFPYRLLDNKNECQCNANVMSMSYTKPQVVDFFKIKPYPVQQEVHVTKRQ